MDELRPHVLIADDESDIRSLLRILLEKEGYAVLEAADGEEAVSRVREAPEALSLIILDIMMPRLSGTEAAARIRGLTEAPILFLTARSSDADKTEAYASGGDDYIVKPFHAIDLTLKASAMIRRFRTYHEQAEIKGGKGRELRSVVFPGDVEWRPEEGTVYRLGERIQLTEREYELFVRLCKSRGENLSPATLYEDVWGEPYLSSSSNTVIVHIANLRRKLEKDPSSPVLIRTVWGKGYRIDEA